MRFLLEFITSREKEGYFLFCVAEMRDGDLVSHIDYNFEFKIFFIALRIVYYCCKVCYLK